MLLWSANLGATGVAIATAALTASGYAPTPVTPQIVAPTTGAITSQGYAPNVYIPEGMPFGPLLLFGLNLQHLPNNPDPGDLVSLGYVPTVAAGGIESLGDDELNSELATMSGTGVRVIPGDQTRFPAKVSATFTGYAGTLKYNAVMQPGAGSLVSLGYTSILDNPLAMEAGEANFEGYAPLKLFFEDQRIDVDPASGILTGFAPNPSAHIDVPSGLITSTSSFFTLDDLCPVPKGSGTFAGYLPVIAGEGFIWDGSGDFTSRRALVTGAGVSTAHGTGTLTSPLATITATAANVAIGYGILDGGYATLNASGYKGNGILDSLRATMIGVGTVIEGAQSLDEITLIIRSKGITTTIKSRSISMQIEKLDIDGQN
jgi:hypothetical protein